MTQRPFYAYPSEAPPEAVPVEAPVDDPHSVKWGYNLADLDKLARIAVSRSLARGGNYQDRYEAAWAGIAETLCTAGAMPDRADLIAAGWRAVTVHVQSEAHHRGYSFEAKGPLVRFEQYWTPRPTHSPERRIVEKYALSAIIPKLSPRQWEAIKVLAATEDYALAAQAMGLSDKSFRVQLSQARRTFLKWWHEGETPSTIWRTDRRLYSRDGYCRGKKLMTASQVEEARARYHDGETLSVIAADYGYKKAGLSSLLNGRSKPAPVPS